MALRQALQRLAPYASSRLAPRAVSGGAYSLAMTIDPTDTLIDPHPRPLPTQFGTSAAWRSAEAVQEEAAAPLPEPETTGWGQTRVGELLKAKVRQGLLLGLWALGGFLSPPPLPRRWAACLNPF